MALGKLPAEAFGLLFQLSAFDWQRLDPGLNFCFASSLRNGKQISIIIRHDVLYQRASGIGQQRCDLFGFDYRRFTTLRLQLGMSGIEIGLKDFKVETGFLELGVKLVEPIPVCLPALFFPIDLGVERNESAIQLALLLDLRASHRFGDADTSA